MNRPSRQIDERLIEAGMALLPQTGCAGLSVRQLTERAGVNLGMFHYHFRNKDNFIRIVLQRVYEEMFGALQLRIVAGAPALENLRGALTVLGGFAVRHRALLVTLVAEAMRGEALPAAFLRDNLPRHIGVLAQLAARGQAEGSIVPLPVPQLLPFLFGALAGPLLAGAAIERHGVPQPAMLVLTSEDAFAQRIDLALRAITVETPP
jgi:AcrR family transcriptional regulator